MNLSQLFIHRPVGTTLLALAVAMSGGLAYFFLPVSSLPQVEFPTIRVSANLPGASPEIMASAVATPLERQFGRIAGVSEMTSTSNLGSTNITLQFDLSREINAAARDVQAAINAAAGQLPSNLPSQPTYRKVNPAESPIMILSLTSELYDTGKMYDAAASILQQKLSQVSGIGQVIIGGGALPAVRVEVHPAALNQLGLGLDDVRTALNRANVNGPKGQLSDEQRTWTLDLNDQIFEARDYQPLIIAFRNGAAVRLSDVATVTDGVEDDRSGGLANGKPAVSLILFRQPGANIIATVDRVRELLPQLDASIPEGIELKIMLDRTTTIRASIREIGFTLFLSVCLVILVVFIFLRDPRATLIPSVAVPISLIGTFGVMYLAGYSIDNLSLMALTIATGFVVDDAIVVIENITRYREQGMAPLQAALRGAREIGFTVLSISISLVAVFIPILLMGGIVGRLFREFAVVLSVAVGISLVVSLTATPMMCANILHTRRHEERGRIDRLFERMFAWVHRKYAVVLAHALDHPRFMILIVFATIGLSVYLYVKVPKELFPQQDTGRLSGRIVADQNTSSQAMKQLMAQYAQAILDDPAIESVVVTSGRGPGGGQTNLGSLFVNLKPLDERKLSAGKIIERLRGKLAGIPGAAVYLNAQQDLTIGGRQGSGQYQYTLQGDNIDELAAWTPQVLQKMQSIPGLVDVNSDQQNRGLEAELTIDRTTAAKLGLTQQKIVDTLYNAFGQRQVSTIYTELNQYRVVMEVDPHYSQNPGGLNSVYAIANGANGPAAVPLNAFAQSKIDTTYLVVNHQSQFPSATISFNLTPGASLGDAVTDIEQLGRTMGLPASIRGRFAGTAQAFKESVASQPILILAALVTVYLVLGMLYESLIHPITILSTLPSAGVGALLALLLFDTSLSVIALIGIILLIGIVKKNAILMIDFALDAERREGKSPRDAIFQACLLRFRPITMTTMAALLGGLPLALGTGAGSELRRPLGIAIVGGLIVSQALTLFTTPVIYLYMDRFRLWCRGLLLGGRPEHVVEDGRHAMIGKILSLGLLLLLPAALISCKVGPNYQRPPLNVPESYSSPLIPETAESRLGLDWWLIFQDPELDALIAEALDANLDLQAAVARVTQARAAAAAVRSQFYPVVVLDPSATRARVPATDDSGVIVNATVGPTRRNFFQLPFDLTYELDVWGRVRRANEAVEAQIRFSVYDLEVVRQTLLADLVQNYFNLCSFEEQGRIVNRNTELYREQLELTQMQYDAGLVSEANVLQARTILDSTLVQEIELRRARANVEHAIAILLGRPPAQFTLSTRTQNFTPPVIPVGLPADLLRRRPDVAEAEQNLITASAQIGVAQANLFPALRIDAAAGFESAHIGELLKWDNHFWTIGSNLTAPIFTGGSLRANLEQARARYRELEANYHNVVLGAFRDVEDALTDLNLRAAAAEAQARAVASAREYQELTQRQYQTGLINYLQLIDADRTVLANELAQAQILNQRLISTILLIKALGGGWDAQALEVTPAQQ